MESLKLFFEKFSKSNHNFGENLNQTLVEFLNIFKENDHDQVFENLFGDKFYGPYLIFWQKLLNYPVKLTPTNDLDLLKISILKNRIDTLNEFSFLKESFEVFNFFDNIDNKNFLLEWIKIFLVLNEQKRLKVYSFNDPLLFHKVLVRYGLFDQQEINKNLLNYLSVEDKSYYFKFIIKKLVFGSLNYYLFVHSFENYYEKSCNILTLLSDHGIDYFYQTMDSSDNFSFKPDFILYYIAIAQVSDPYFLKVFIQQKNLKEYLNKYKDFFLNDTQLAKNVKEQFIKQILLIELNLV